MGGHYTKADALRWRQSVVLNTDCEPHRSELLLALGQASVVCGLVSLPWELTAVQGLVMGLCVGVVSRRDLGKMRRGLMDPGGERQTRRATHAAVVGVALSLVGGWFLCGHVLWFLGF